MVMTTKAILHHWLAIAAIVILTLMMATAWQARQLTLQYGSAELSRTNTVASRTLAADIEHAIGYGIPIEKLAGVEEWLTDIIDANPVIMAIAITDIHGDFLSGQSISPDLKNALRQQRAAQHTQLAGFNVATTPLHQSPNKNIVGWLHVASQSVDTPYKVFSALALYAAMIFIIAALSLRQLLRRHLVAPIARCHDALVQMCDGKLSTFSPAEGNHPAALLQSALYARMRQLLWRKEQTLARLTEVRAAHFAPAVLTEIDSLIGACNGLLAAATSASSTAAGSVRRQGLTSSFISGSIVTALIVVACTVYVLTRTIGANENRNIIALHTQSLEYAWETITTNQRSRLEQLINVTQSQILAAALNEQSDAAHLEKMLISNAIPGVTLTLARQDGSVVASSASQPEHTRPGSSLLELLMASQTPPRGIWQNNEFEYEIGATQLLSAKGYSNPLVLIATQPLKSSISDLEQRTNTQVALVDLRGKTVFEHNASIVDIWHSHHRKNFAGFISNKESVLGTIPLIDAAGYTIGGLISLQMLASQYTPWEKTRGVLAVLAGLCAAFLALAYASVFFKRLEQSSRELESLAADQPTSSGGASKALNPERLKHTAALLIRKFSALNKIKRSHDRQGQRQARFIRHHMIGLASQLPDRDRADIIDELVEVQLKTQPAQCDGQTPRNDTEMLQPDVENPIDEIGVIAHSFQNLANRLGKQYRELDRLVVELRDALHSKTELLTLKGELEAARKLQSSILPKNFKISAHFELQATVVPAQEVGGDFYDFFLIDEHRMAIIIADVSGKGIPGALFMAICRTLLRAVVQFLDTPSQCLERLNNILAQNNDQTMFVTLFYAVIDSRDGTMTYANAGHNPPYLIRSCGPAEPIAPTGGIPLAIMEGFLFEEHRLVLNANDRLFLYTDGVTEALDPKQTLFGEARLEQLLESVRAMPIADVPQYIINELNVFAADAPQADDITCFMLAYQSADSKTYPMPTEPIPKANNPDSTMISRANPVSASKPQRGGT